MEFLKKCPLCDSFNIKFLFNIKDFSGNNDELFVFSQCLDCDIIFLSKRPKEQKIKNYYYKNYLPFSGKYNYIVKKFIKIRTLSEVKLFNKFNKHINNVLEIGCAYGKYLKDLRNYKGYNVTGVEIDKDCCIRGKNRYGIDIKNGNLKEIEFSNNSFDLIVMNHVIEHLYNPIETLKKTYRILKKNGLIIIKTPNFKTLERTMFGKYWLPYEAPRHLFIYSEKILKKILQDAGFKVVNVCYEKTPNNIILSIRNYLIDKLYCKNISKFININNYFLLLLFFPLSFILGLTQQSGRIVIIAKKFK